MPTCSVLSHPTYGSGHRQVYSAPEPELCRLIIGDHGEGTCGDSIKGRRAGRGSQKGTFVGPSDEEDVNVSKLLAIVEDLDLTLLLQLEQELLDLIDPWELVLG